MKFSAVAAIAASQRRATSDIKLASRGRSVGREMRPEWISLSKSYNEIGERWI